MLSVNYSDDYNNPFAAGGPQEVASWTTADLSATYEFRGATGLRSSLRLTLSVQNLFDEDPPFVGSSGQVGPALQQPVGFDPTNANPLGRLLVVGVSKTW
jgi:outer membrane receptor protein involved in Fe transport